MTGFLEGILERMIFDGEQLAGEQLAEQFEPLDLGWRERTRRELGLMEDIVPLLKKRAGGGRTISGLSAYEEGR